MEKRVAKKVEQHTVDFKTAIKNYLSEGNLAVVDKVEGGSDRTSDFLKYVFLNVVISCFPSIIFYR